MAAPAYDAAGGGGSGSLSFVNGATLTATWSHNCSGNDRIVLVVGEFTGGSTAPGSIAMSCTYDGAAMTLLTYTSLNGGNGSKLGLFYLLNPPTGSKTVVLSITSPNNVDRGCAGNSISFTGVKGISNGAVAVGSGTSMAQTFTGAVGPAQVVVQAFFAAATISSYNQTAGPTAIEGSNRVAIGYAAGSSSVAFSATRGSSGTWASLAATLDPVDTTADASLAITASPTGASAATLQCSASMAATASLSTAGSRGQGISASLGVTATPTGVDRLGANAQSSTNITAALAAAILKTLNGTATLAVTATSAAAGVRNRVAGASLSGTATPAAGALRKTYSAAALAVETLAVSTASAGRFAAAALVIAATTRATISGPREVVLVPADDRTTEAGSDPRSASVAARDGAALVGVVSRSVGIGAGARSSTITASPRGATVPSSPRTSRVTGVDSNTSA